VANLQRRLERLEAASAQQDTPAWPEVDAALRRQTARVRLVVGERLGTAADHYAMVDARETLGEDTPEQEAADLELISRWRCVHRTAEVPGDVRQRLREKIDAIARRVRARVQQTQRP
jgi:hypothetical protein